MLTHYGTSGNIQNDIHHLIIVHSIKVGDFMMDGGTIYQENTENTLG